MLGVVTRILRKVGGGFVLAETGDEMFFGYYYLDGIGIDGLEKGQWVEFEVYELEMGRATITRLRSERCLRFRNSQYAWSTRRSRQIEGKPQGTNSSKISYLRS